MLSSALPILQCKTNSGFPETTIYALVIRLEPEKHAYRFVNTYYFDLEVHIDQVNCWLIKHKIELKN